MTAPLVVFGEDWGRHPSSTQHLVRRLAAEAPVIWVNSIGMRRPRLDVHDVRRAAGKVFRSRQALGSGPAPVPPPAGMTVVSPLAVSWPGSRLAFAANRDYSGELEQAEYEDADLAALKQKLVDARTSILEAVKFVKTQSTAYLDFSGRRLVDSAITVICGHLFLGQAVKCERKKLVAKRYIQKGLAQMQADLAMITSGDTTPLDAYQLLAGPVPSAS